MNEPLTFEGDNDYTLNSDEQSVWIAVGGISVYIRHTSNGKVSVALYVLGEENEPAIDKAEAFYG